MVCFGDSLASIKNDQLFAHIRLHFCKCSNKVNALIYDKAYKFNEFCISIGNSLAQKFNTYSNVSDEGNGSKNVQMFNFVFIIFLLIQFVFDEICKMNNK